MDHDMFTPQPTTGVFLRGQEQQRPLEVDLFMFRFVMHDWPDEAVVKILQSLLPAMRKHDTRNPTRQCRVLVMDYLLSDKPSEQPGMAERLER